MNTQYELDMYSEESEIQYINDQLICISGEEYSISEEDLNFIFEELIFIMNNNCHKFNENEYKNIPMIEAVPLIISLSRIRTFLSQIPPHYDKNLGEKINGFIERMIEQEVLKPEITKKYKNVVGNILNGKKI